MPVSVKIGGVWKTASAVYTKINGAWKNASDMPVKVGGVWKTGILSQPITVNYLVLAGGGDGGSTGGGGGGYVESSIVLDKGTTHTVTVGAGSAALVSNASRTSNAPNGNNSVFGGITALGGGSGGSSPYPNTAIGSNGGCGGGSYNASYGGTGYQGGNGGFTAPGGSGSSIGNGAGGGAGGNGGNGITGYYPTGGMGGDGRYSSITGTSIGRGGGGGSSGYGTQHTSTQTDNFGGGLPGNTAASYNYRVPIVNRGGGGVGAPYVNNDPNPYRTSGGSSGIVILSYPTSAGLATATTGSPTVTTVGSNYVYQFTGSGSITL